MYEVIQYQPARIFIFTRPEFPKDFCAQTPLKRKTKSSAMETVKGLNAVVETVDAPYLPIQVYQIHKNKRKLIWSQAYEIV